MFCRAVYQGVTDELWALTPPADVLAKVSLTWLVCENTGSSAQGKAFQPSFLFSSRRRTCFMKPCLCERTLRSAFEAGGVS